MMRKFISRILMSLAISLVLTTNSYAGTWRLINQQFQGGSFYCTYQLVGSNPPITKTIQKADSCEMAFTD